MKTVTRESRGIVIEVDCEPEHWIKRQLRQGNEWAWCCAHIRVTYKGILTGDDYLGCCSYKGSSDFVDSKFRIESPDGTVTHAGYYDDMVDECLSQINAQLARLCED